MSREKQIEEQAVEEMARDMCDSCREAVTAEECQLNCCDGVRQHAEALYARGYRKQSEGEWILTQEKRLFGDKYYTCSNCQIINPTMIKFNYCFNCGARMSGGQNEQCQ